MIRTELARIIEGEWTGKNLNKVTLVIMPREQLYVYAGEITPVEFALLKEKACFITLEFLIEGQQLPSITNVIPPFPQAMLSV